MTIDVTQYIGAVTRQLTSGQRDGRPTRIVTATRSYDTTVEDLWDALTSSERIPRWFLPVAGDLRLGGHYQLTGNAGGTITRCEPPRALGLTWECGGDVSWVEVQLAEDPAGGVRLRLEHTAHVPDDRWEEYGPGAVGVGWDLALMGLGAHFSTSAAVDPSNAAAWLASVEGKAFIGQSSDSWGQASVAAGTNSAAATAAAARTTTAYTGGS